MVCLIEALKRGYTEDDEQKVRNNKQKNIGCDQRTITVHNFHNDIFTHSGRYIDKFYY